MMEKFGLLLNLIKTTIAAKTLSLQQDFGKIPVLLAGVHVQDFHFSMIMQIVTMILEDMFSMESFTKLIKEPLLIQPTLILIGSLMEFALGAAKKPQFGEELYNIKKTVS